MYCILLKDYIYLPYKYGISYIYLLYVSQLLYYSYEGDFPKLDEYKAALTLSDFSTFPLIDRKVLNILQDMLLKDVPKVDYIYFIVYILYTFYISMYEYI